MLPILLFFLRKRKKQLSVDNYVSKIKGDDVYPMCSLELGYLLDKYLANNPNHCKSHPGNLDDIWPKEATDMLIDKAGMQEMLNKNNKKGLEKERGNIQQESLLFYEAAKKLITPYKNQEKALIQHYQEVYPTDKAPSSLEELATALESKTVKEQVKFNFESEKSPSSNNDEKQDFETTPYRQEMKIERIRDLEHMDGLENAREIILFYEKNILETNTNMPSNGA